MSPGRYVQKHLAAADETPGATRYATFWSNYHEVVFAQPMSPGLCNHIVQAPTQLELPVRSDEVECRSGA